MATITGPAPANHELPESGSDPITQAIATFEARGEHEQRRYVPGELARQYHTLGAHERYADLQQVVANAWREDNPTWIHPNAGAPIYPTMRERARSNPATQARDERAAELRASMTLDALLAASKLAVANYPGDDKAARAAARAVGRQMYHMLHPGESS